MNSFPFHIVWASFDSIALIKRSDLKWCSSIRKTWKKRWRFWIPKSIYFSLQCVRLVSCFFANKSHLKPIKFWKGKWAQEVSW